MSTENTFFEDETQNVLINRCFYYDQFFLYGENFTVEITNEMLDAMIKYRDELKEKSNS